MSYLLLGVAASATHTSPPYGFCLPVFRTPSHALVIHYDTASETVDTFHAQPLPQAETSLRRKGAGFLGADRIQPGQHKLYAFHFPGDRVYIANLENMLGHLGQWLASTVGVPPELKDQAAELLRHAEADAPLPRALLEQAHAYRQACTELRPSRTDSL